MKDAYNWSGRTILIVEDDDPSFIYASEILKVFQPKIKRCKSGLVAFFDCMDYPVPDLVIMDIKLPEMNGYDATKLIKKYRPSIPVIALTACAMQEEKQRCLSAGCDYYLTKPILPKELFTIIDCFLHQISYLAEAQLSLN